ncbi:MAG: hypothetical protein KAH95_05190 [Spirochaetales bacterium]|nr:hypothetical protein [Spirochaetales bacterium]
MKYCSKEFFVHTHPEKTESPEFETGYVYLEKTYFKEFYGYPFKDKCNKPWKRPVLKISINDPECKKRVIRCLYRGGNVYKMTRKDIGFTKMDASILGIKGKDSVELTLSKSSKFLYYWNHPVHYNRVSFKLAILLGGFSIIISLQAQIAALIQWIFRIIFRT